MTMQATRVSATFTDEPELFSPAPKLPMKPPMKPMVRKLEKAPHAFRTISEVGEELNVPQHVLRFWETRFTQLRPLKRGGGRRYYRSEDVILLRQIHSLLYAQGYTIKGAQKVLKERGPEREAPAENKVAAPPAPVDSLPVENEGHAPPASANPGSDATRAMLMEMLDELKALRALV